MNAVDLILTKRDGGALSAEQIYELIDEYTRGAVPDYQMSAFLMASFLNGMSDEEAVALTHAMLHSGDQIDLSSISGVKVDKHSTGGVGDKVSLILAPLVAACGVPVPMISGRGLGHTGGTLDKLESIPGFRSDLDEVSYRKQLEEIGVVMIGQTADIAPADKKLYALRDVTGTVEFIPFIVASIMSKKMAEGCDALVLDVKCGSGANIRGQASARNLAENLVDIGEHYGKRTVAWLTDMSTPLGRCVGNWPEMVESIGCLKGADIPDLMEVTLTLAGEMIVLGKKAETFDAGVRLAEEVIASGAAFEKFVELVSAQGGDVSVLNNPDRRSNSGVIRTVLVPETAGPILERIDALTIGKAAVDLGAGRGRKEDDVDPIAGMKLLKKEGDPVQPGEPLLQLFATREEQIERIIDRVQSAFTYTETPFSVGSRLIDRYSDGRWMNPSGRPSV